MQCWAKVSQHHPRRYSFGGSTGKQIENKCSVPDNKHTPRGRISKPTLSTTGRECKHMHKGLHENIFLNASFSLFLSFFSIFSRESWLATSSQWGVLSFTSGTIDACVQHLIAGYTYTWYEATRAATTGDGRICLRWRTPIPRLDLSLIHI